MNRGSSPDTQIAASALDLFIATPSDDARLALGLDTLRDAWEEATDQGLVGWAVEINEYLHALESGKGLNRPL